ncbi:MAG: hypothetical protein ACTSQJ_00370 [Promethearchaeota archaeon]
MPVSKEQAIKNYVLKQIKAFDLELDEVPEKMLKKLYENGEKWFRAMQKGITKNI